MGVASTTLMDTLTMGSQHRVDIVSCGYQTSLAIID